ncbi:MAG TPA: carotenoid oxygenase family protein [Methylibium sp.]|uniref:carotenoid oxygenase family protein n=1 Tax=Methylibium sp. TaxID=2067992 RepID=UPI002DB60386|nr:carotenoid oxygenase family protein [Methylibium sp.]HEU4459649.1 carotenoid oxygenase family protein [Methylibium sp.]
MNAPLAASSDSSANGLRFPDLLVYRGHAAPVRMEVDVQDCEVIGAIPPGLNGAYYRNSADPTYPPLLGTDIFLNGDGMVHMVRLENGHADLKTRYVRTEKFELERKARRALFGAYRNPFTDAPEVAGRDNNTANTSMLWHHGRLYALKESGRPYELDPATLATLGERDFGGTLKSRTFTAHPKLDPQTGEAIAFAYNTEGVASDEIELYTIDPRGAITRTERFKAPYCSMAHDFLVSRNFIVFVICPMVCDWERVKRGEPYWHWDSTKKTRVAVIPRKEGVKGIRWFTSPKLAMQTHTFNAWEEETNGGTTLHLDHFVTESGWLSQFPDLHDPDAKEKPPFGERWSLDLASPDDRIEQRRLIPHIGEMPTIDPRFSMTRAWQFWFGTSNPALGPMLEWGPKGPPFTCLGHFDEAAGKLDFWYAGADSSPEEPHFVPRHAGAAEGDGWLLAIVGRRAENRSDLVILDAMHLGRGPVAVVRFPCRVHEGFHGTWVPQNELLARS